MISKKMFDAMNEQIKNELGSSAKFMGDRWLG